MGSTAALLTLGLWYFSGCSASPKISHMCSSWVGFLYTGSRGSRERDKALDDHSRGWVAPSGKPGRSKCSLARPCVFCVAVWPHYGSVRQTGNGLASVRPAKPGSRMWCFSTGQELCSLAHPLQRPQESPGAGKAFRGWQECREGTGILPPYHNSFLKSTVGALEVHSRSTCLGSPDTSSLWP